ncbi:Protein strictosidine synthase-like 12 [Vitis vinifera]|uniref:Protein strictosidine synthase-like 12 n=1 Tax=Vitis vinifera TaxID=29760 RepID=A0A438C1R2_VITVI|nr:Protein strictosidine synthase-like 12 [Vitis vinifera]
MSIEIFVNPTSTVAMISIFLLLFFSVPHTVLTLSFFTQLQLPPNVTGPEALAFDRLGGGPYTGVSDGRVLKYGGPSAGFTDFAYTTPTRSKAVCDGTTDPNSGPTCGRPLGVGFNNLTGELYIADAYSGLLVVGSNGGLATPVATTAEGVPFRFLNGLDVDQLTGNVYFTDASSVYELRDITQGVENNDASGRLLKYDPSTKQVTVLIRGLSGPAGAAVSRDGSFVLVSEFIANRTQKFWLRGPKANTSELFFTFQGRPDNIKTSITDTFWVAVNIGKSVPTTVPTGQRMDAHGNVLQTVNFEAEYGSTMISEVQGRGEIFLYVGSRDASYVGVYTLKDVLKK